MATVSVQFVVGCVASALTDVIQLLRWIWASSVVLWSLQRTIKCLPSNAIAKSRCETVKNERWTYYVSDLKRFRCCDDMKRWMIPPDVCECCKPFLPFVRRISRENSFFLLFQASVGFGECSSGLERKLNHSRIRIKFVILFFCRFSFCYISQNAIPENDG